MHTVWWRHVGLIRWVDGTWRVPNTKRNLEECAAGRTGKDCANGWIAIIVCLWAQFFIACVTFWYLL